jgi:hypothetical protein
MTECTKKIKCEDCALNNVPDAWCKDADNPETDRRGNIVDGSDDFCLSCGAHYDEDCACI